MSKKLTEFNFELEVPIKYAYEGEMVDGTFITLKAPSSKNMLECSVLKQAFFRALPTDTDSTQNSSDDDGEKADLTGDAIMTLIMMSQNVELATIIATARDLFSSGVALLEGETKVTKPILDDIDPDDLERMIGDYLVNFILASSLKRLNAG